jgi:hypothetical protein
MQIEHLQIELRPRTNAQALDLGFALLRAHAGASYGAFLALWVPLVALGAGLGYLFPDLQLASLWLVWWLKPMLERAPLYVLSRGVFGTTVTWQEAVRAWPRQLGGGAIRLLTWGRIFTLARSLYHPVWQLEHARGKVASARLRALGKGGTARSAFWFGVVCVHFEAVLQLGLLGFIGIFISDSDFTNPLYLFSSLDKPEMALLLTVVYGVAAGIVAPVYTACGFTLYLNRRATLEAWDIEIALRQIRPPAAPRARGRTTAALGAGVAAMLLVLSMALPQDAHAAPAPACVMPDAKVLKRSPDNGPRQAAIRQQVDKLYAGEALRDVQCVKVRRFKDDAKDKDKPKAKESKPNNLDWLASLFKAMFIAAGIGAVAWLLYRYRDKFPALRRARLTVAATEVGGLDIRPESLPADVAGAARALWAEGQRRAALALLYRATLSRLVSDNALALYQGNTEGDCLRLAARAHTAGQLGAGRFAAATTATTVWLNAAYGDRWPDDSAMFAACDAWQAEFGVERGRAAA